MRAIGYTHSLPASDHASLLDITLPQPQPGPHDLRIAVEAVSVNPVDTKIRQRSQPETGYTVLGYDAAGTVIEVGAEVRHYQIGDTVYYAGDMTRPGTNAEYHCVDERLVGRKPVNLSMLDAAALPPQMNAFFQQHYPPETTAKHAPESY